MIVLRGSGNGRGSSLSTAFIRECGAHLIRKHSNLQMYDSVRFDVLCDSIHSLFAPFRVNFPPRIPETKNPYLFKGLGTNSLSVPLRLAAIILLIKVADAI